MRSFALLRAAVAVSCVSVALARNILLTNDDGWAVAQIRAQYEELTDAGFDVVLSCPAENMSGTGSTTATPTVLTEPCEYDTCPVGSPAEGFNASNPRFNYVNAYPVDAAHYGIQTLAPKFFWGAKPEFVVSGPNIGNNLGTVVLISGTVGAACESAKEGIPATAFSGGTGSQVSYTTLESDPTASSSESSWLYGVLTVHYVETLLDTFFYPVLPPGIIVNVNYAPIDDCPSTFDYKWVFSRNLADANATDIWTCGSTTLPAESDVVATSGCYNSVSVLNATTKADVGADLQLEVYTRLLGLPFSCLPSSSS
ncbi:sure-like protein [Daedalea quercina L-15889]|uniref:Sure-like protein n=1 Tax=Daedalea quercina L-15889 TaxID=1314783 RepID=A0A165QHD7_9APHY|nr:sure-like protein [Daedalea quercina L-15889]